MKIIIKVSVADPDPFDTVPDLAFTFGILKNYTDPGPGLDPDPQH
jgi:hypothetical protein